MFSKILVRLPAGIRGERYFDARLATSIRVERLARSAVGHSRGEIVSILRLTMRAFLPLRRQGPIFRNLSVTACFT